MPISQENLYRGAESAAPPENQVFQQTVKPHMDMWTNSTPKGAPPSQTCSFPKPITRQPLFSLIYGAGQHPAVYRQNMAGHETRGIGCPKDRRSDEFPPFSETVHGRWAK